MGGSKKSAKPPPKKESKYKIPTVFNCPKCGGKGTISIQIKRAPPAEGYVFCNGECSRLTNYEAEVDVEEGGRKRPGQKRSRETENYKCGVLRLEEPVDVFFKYYEAYREQREIELGGGGDENGIDEANTFALREAGGAYGQPISGAARRHAHDDDDDEDAELLLEQDETEFEDGFAFGEVAN